MTTYSAITNGQVDQDSPITQPLMTALRDNPIAITEGSSGAPKIQTAAIQDAAVNRVKLKTGTNSAAYSFGGGGGSLTVNLDPYSFFPSMSGGASNSIGGSGTADTPAVLLTSPSSNSGTLAWRYIQA